MKRQIIVMGFAAAILAGIILTSLILKPAVGRAFDSLRLGMSIEEVRDLYGKNPDFEAYFREFSILYYRPPPRRILDFSGDIDLSVHRPGSRYASLNEIPEPYAWDMLAIRNERLFAYTVVGEVYKVKTAKGAFSGSEFSDVPAEVWEEQPEAPTNR
jgi:hypothetical protein